MVICYIVWNEPGQSTDRCFEYINKQIFPENVEVQAVSAEVTEDLGEALQEAYEAVQADAYFVIYAGAAIIDEEFTQKAVRLLENDENIGIIGLSGYTKLPYDGILWRGQNLGPGKRAEEIPGIYKRHAVCDIAYAEGLDDALLVIRNHEVLHLPVYVGMYGYGAMLALVYKKRGLSCVVMKQETAAIRLSPRSIDPEEYEKSRRKILTELKSAYQL